MTLVIDMNLSPKWVGYLSEHGVDSMHWGAIGDPRSSDVDILSWVRARGHVLLTHDLDFGLLLSMTRAAGPSVIQARTPDVSPESLGPHVLVALANHGAALETGAIVTVEPLRSRVRVLPIHRS